MYFASKDDIIKNYASRRLSYFASLCPKANFVSASFTEQSKMSLSALVHYVNDTICFLNLTTGFHCYYTNVKMFTSVRLIE